MWNSRLQYIAGFLATMSSFIGGNCSGWTSPIKVKLDSGQTPFTCTDSEWGLVAAVACVGSLFGSLTSALMADYFGCKTTILSSAPIFLLGWGIAYFGGECYILYLSRALSGLGGGLVGPACAIYIAEITEARIRGRIASIMIVMHHAGNLFSYSLGPYLEYQTFVLILSIFPFIFFITFAFMPETPFYRLKQGNPEAAKQLMLKYRGLADEICIIEEFELMQKTVQDEMLNKTSIKELVMKSRNRTALATMIGIKMIQYLSGVGVISAYLQPIFEASKSSIPSAYSSIICGSVQLIASLFTTAVMDRIGRRPLLITSTLGSGIFLFFLGLFFFLKDQLKIDMSSFQLSPLLLLVGLLSFQTLGVGPVPSIMLGELFPTNIKYKAAGLLSAYGSLFVFFLTLLFSYITEFYGMFDILWLFAACMAFGVVFVVFYVMETNRKTLMEIQTELKTGYPAVL